MKARLQAAWRWFVGLGERERWLVFGGAVGIPLVMWNFLVLDPYMAEREVLEGKIQTAQTQTMTLRAEFAKLKAVPRPDPNREVRERIEALEREHERLDERLRQLSVGFIGPTQMPQVLRQILEEGGKLRLLALENMGAERVALGGDEQARTRLYRHGLRLEFEGGYLEILDYLKRLEALPWRVYWDDLDLVAEDFPKVRATLTVYTLSLDAQWIGV